MWEPLIANRKVTRLAGEQGFATRAIADRSIRRIIPAPAAGACRNSGGTQDSDRDVF
jgi:hypothetical protein